MLMQGKLMTYCLGKYCQQLACDTSKCNLKPAVTPRATEK